MLRHVSQVRSLGGPVAEAEALGFRPLSELAGP